VVSAHTNLPVIGVPGRGKDLGSQDSLYSIAQMPRGVPVACVGVNRGDNAGLLAGRIIALTDKNVKNNLNKWVKNMKEESLNKVDMFL
jgi:phosphoribosylaminoimidazole carboxylase PurE protein